MLHEVAVLRVKCKETRCIPLLRAGVFCTVLVLSNSAGALTLAAQEPPPPPTDGDDVSPEPAPAEVTGGLWGSVRSAEMSPITAATVTLPEIGRMAVTNGQGEFYVRDVPPGTHAVEVAYLGLKYQTRARIDGNKLTLKHYRLDLTLAELEPLRVQADAAAAATLKMREFVGRQAREAGLYIGRDDIDRLKPLTTGDLLYGKAGVDVEEGRVDRSYNIGRGPGTCRPNLFIDGAPVEALGVDDYFPQHIEAIEVYKTFVQTPIQYRSRNRCGAILIWTRETFE